jgi:hypothetical protein
MRLSRVLALVVLSTTGLTAATHPPIPNAFRSSNPHRYDPIWISSKAVLDGSGTLRPDAISEDDMMPLNAIVSRHQNSRELRDAAVGAASSDECDVRLAPPFDDARDLGSTPTWQAVTETRAPFYSGTVTDAEEGLYSGMPFTVFQVRVARTSDPSSPEYVYILYPRGAFKLGSTRICASSAGFADAPSISDTVFFVTNESVDPGGFLFRIGADRLFVSHGQRLIRPPRLARDPELKGIDTVRELESLFAERERGARIR